MAFAVATRHFIRFSFARRHTFDSGVGFGCHWRTKLRDCKVHLRQICLALDDTYSLTLLRGVFLTGQSVSQRHRTAVTNLTRSAEAMPPLPRAFEAGAMPVIASIILLALIVAAVGRGTLILARRLQALHVVVHDISAASLFAL